MHKECFTFVIDLNMEEGMDVAHDKHAAKKLAKAEKIARFFAKKTALVGDEGGEEGRMSKRQHARSRVKGGGGGYRPRDTESGRMLLWENAGLFRPRAILPPSSGSSDDEDRGLYKQQKHQKQQGRRFCMVLPPPNVTGALHIGHALTHAVQDAIVRWHRMRGDSTLWVPGTDHAGIATQAVVERSLQHEQGIVSRHELGREKFIHEVWAWVGKYGNRIQDQTSRLGSSLDATRRVFTMDRAMSRAVNEAFVRLHADGLVYRACRVVNWCCHLRTTVSDIEVDHVDVSGRTLIAVPGYAEPVEFGVLTRFAYVLDDDTGREIVVATTRPETVPGDVAVAVHPEDPRYTSYVGRFVKHPFSGRRLPVVADAVLVDPAFGTGAVKITPGHDAGDLDVAKRHGIASHDAVLMEVFDDQGCLNAAAGPAFEGMPRFEARKVVVKALEAAGLLRGITEHAMRVAICSRSGDVIEPRVKPQWWIKCADMGSRACEAVRTGALQIVPRDFETSWYAWLGADRIRDWCVSRQLWWGHRVPAYRVVFQTPRIFHDQEGEDEWVVGVDEAAARKEAERRFPDAGPFRLAQDEDVLDTWFSSGIYPFAALGWPDATPDMDAFYPTDLLETGHDILFFWVARMTMLGQQLTGQLPFKKVCLHAMIRDAHGRKMSKSLGNVVDPMDVIDGISLGGLLDKLASGNLPEAEHARAAEALRRDFPDGIEECGTDALRFALCAYTVQTRDINLDIKRVVAYRHWCNKLVNAARFVAMHLPTDYVPPPPLDPPRSIFRPSDETCEWIMSRLDFACDEVSAAMEVPDLGTATQAVYSFLRGDFCDVFIERVKPLLAASKSDGGKGGDGLSTTTSTSANADAAFKKAETVDTLWIVLEAGLRLLHPFMPFLTEELWQSLTRGRVAFKEPSAVHSKGDGSSNSIMIAPYPRRRE